MTFGLPWTATVQSILDYKARESNFIVDPESVIPNDCTRFSTSNPEIFEEYNVILFSQALHHRGRRCRLAVVRDSVLLEIRFARIKADFTRAYPRPLHGKALAATLRCAELAVMALKHRIPGVARRQTAAGDQYGCAGGRGRTTLQESGLY